MKKILMVKSEVGKEVMQFMEDHGIAYEIAEIPGQFDNTYLVVSTRGYGKYEKLSSAEYWDDVGNPYTDFKEYLDFVYKSCRKWMSTPRKNFSDLDDYINKGLISRSLAYVLIRNNCTTEELMNMTDEERMSLRGVGKKKHAELTRFMENLRR